jgi:hypothetical protein
MTHQRENDLSMIMLPNLYGTRSSGDTVWALFVTPICLEGPTTPQFSNTPLACTPLHFYIILSVT